MSRKFYIPLEKIPLHRKKLHVTNEITNKFAYFTQNALFSPKIAKINPHDIETWSSVLQMKTMNNLVFVQKDRSVSLHSFY
jgi:hypothetical protein